MVRNGRALPQRFHGATTVLAFVACVLWSNFVTAGAEVKRAQEIIATTGVQGGLVIHVGAGDGRLTTSLRVNNRYLIQGLDTDPAAVASARQFIRAQGAYGPVSVAVWDGKHLPYINNLVNLIIAEQPAPAKEMQRVLCPGGVAYVKHGEKWTATIKPRPDDIDEWTHNLHDAGGNAVANDRVVGPPRHLQWTAGPLWARSHGWTPSVSAMVSAQGRLFYIADETLACVDDTVPDKWALIARDAFSGVLLWKRPITEWGSRALSGTHDTGRGVTTGRFTMPSHVAKRLVAVGNTVYATLSATAPVTALKAATGETERVYADTAHADEILVTGEHLIVAINPPPTQRPAPAARGESPSPPPGKLVCAVARATGRTLWKKGPFTGLRNSKGQDPFGRLELAAGDGRVFLLTPEGIHCLAIASGETVWRIDRPALPEKAVRRMGFAGMFEYLLTVMVYHKGVVLLAQPEPNTHHTYHTMPGTLYAFDAASGKRMWKHAYGGWGHCTPPDVFVVNDVVWTHVNAETDFGSVWGNGYKAKNSATVNYRIQALALRTGVLQRELATKDLFNVGHHHRCYRNRITERFLLASRRGVEFVDLATGENFQNHWVRSGCLLGNLPCNGLTYVTPHPCGCYIAAKLTGFNALAPARKATEARKQEQLMRGPAYGQVAGSAPTATAGWPTYRHDPLRSGATDARVGTTLTLLWRAALGTKPSAPVVAGTRVFAAGINTHSIHALNRDTGKSMWTHTTGGRIDSPPTIHGDLAICGSADGRVSCLRAADGKLVWRFDAAPQPHRLVAFGQLESPWPVPGSVLMHDGKCWFAAGRSSYLDGGIRLYALDPATGRIEDRQVIYSPDPATGKIVPQVSANTIPGLLNDIPAASGTSVFIRQLDLLSTKNSRRNQHLFTTGGFLDSSWFNRTYWRYGKAQTTGLMVLGDEVAYGVEVYESRSRETVFKPGANAYRLMCLPVKAPPPAGAAAKKKQRARRRRGPKPRWQQRLPVRVTAMVRAGSTIFVAGSPDIIAQDDPHGALESERGGYLAAFATSDGKELASYELPAAPVWDGMAAVPGRLYIALMNGDIVCYTDKR